MWLRRVLQSLTDPETEVGRPLTSARSPESRVGQISPRELKVRLGDPSLQLVDVREDREFRYCRIDGAVHIPMRQLLTGGESRLDPTKDVVVYCHHGPRSMQTAFYLAARGFRVFNLVGGINAWSAEIDPGVPTY